MKTKWIKELKEDFRGPLEEVRNVWVRRGVCVVFGPVLAVLDAIGGAILGVYENTWHDFILPTWKGPKK